jgi:hypothetical protein
MPAIRIRLSRIDHYTKITGYVGMRRVYYRDGVATPRDRLEWLEDAKSAAMLFLWQTVLN